MENTQVILRPFGDVPVAGMIDVGSVLGGVDDSSMDNWRSEERPAWLGGFGCKRCVIEGVALRGAHTGAVHLSVEFVNNFLSERFVSDQFHCLKQGNLEFVKANLEFREWITLNGVTTLTSSFASRHGPLQVLSCGIWFSGLVPMPATGV